MIVRNLPPPAIFTANSRLVFADHLLITGITEAPWSLPEHEPGMGLVTLLAGSGCCTINHQREWLQSGQFLLINRGSKLALTFPHPGAQPLMLFFHSSLAAEIAARRGVDWCWLERTQVLAGPLRHQLEWLVSSGQSCSSFGALKADSLIRGILGELFDEARTAASISQKLRVTRQATRVQLFKRLALAREWIVAHHASAITIGDMARIAALNTQHFLRMFRDCYGKTPHRFLTDIRLEAARQLLLHSEESVAAICRQTGFESASTFSGLFKERFGRPPSEYRLRP